MKLTTITHVSLDGVTRGGLIIQVYGPAGGPEYVASGG